MNYCTLTKLETEARVAIRNAIRSGQYTTEESSSLFAAYFTGGGVMTYDAMRKDEKAQLLAAGERKALLAAGEPVDDEGAGV